MVKTGHVEIEKLKKQVGATSFNAKLTANLLNQMTKEDARKENVDHSLLTIRAAHLERKHGMTMKLEEKVIIMVEEVDKFKYKCEGLHKKGLPLFYNE